MARGGLGMGERRSIVLVHFENTPKAFANFSPGFERSENPGFSNIKVLRTLKGFVSCGTLSAFQSSLLSVPKVVAVLQPWAEISERLRRYPDELFSGLNTDSLRTCEGISHGNNNRSWLFFD